MAEVGADPQAEESFMARMNRILRTYFPAGKYGERVHRDCVADAFIAGAKAAVAPGIEVSDQFIADEFEDYCGEAYTE